MTTNARTVRRLLGILALLATTSLLAACGDDESTSAGAGGEDAAAHAQGPALEHIHGLGINPADGRLFIATHNGLFAAARDQTRPEQVGETEQDIMGFAVVGPDHFIGSGHPGPDQDLPGNLGLIESRDAGKTWKNVSLLGEADFHVLEHAGNRIYGFDGTQGRLMVSRDGGRKWDERTPPAGVFGLAIEPANASRLIASTENGIFISPDEGRRWRRYVRMSPGCWPGQRPTGCTSSTPEARCCSAPTPAPTGRPRATSGDSRPRSSPRRTGSTRRWATAR